MRVKKFEAKSMKEALQMVKQELGPDAVILAARDNRKSFGLGGEASVEITAAVSEGTLQKKKFTESRLGTQQKEQFASAGARQQREMIEKMIEKRERRAEEDQKVATRKPITKMSYIDIHDDVQESPRRSTAFERAAGRSVDDLLSDFDQDLLTPREAADRQIMLRARAARAREQQEAQQAQARAQQTQSRSQAQARAQAQQQARSPQGYSRTAAPMSAMDRGLANVRAAAAAAREHVAQEQEQHDYENEQERDYAKAPPQGERAIARIRNAAREAWKNNPFTEDSSARQAASVARQASVAHASGLEMVAENDYEDNFRQINLAPKPVGQNQGPEMEKLHGEIKRLERMLEGFQKVPQTFATLHPGADYGLSYDFSHMFQKLAEAGVSTENAVEILKQAEKEIDPAQAKKKPIIDAWVARWFLNNVKTAQTQGRLHLFVGGSGSGKTTSLVKMAAQLVVKEKKKVAILSLDNSKVGAVDQMKIYCQILNVPFAVIRNKQDWEWVFSQLRHVDHILVDYPSTQLREIDEIHALKAMLPPEGFAPITHLCISATSKDGDAIELANRYKVAEPNDLIFTNLDQSVQHGIIYNLQRRTGLPLHSFGIGNRIPEDFEPASKERVLDLIFKLTKLRRETA